MAEKKLVPVIDLDSTDFVEKVLYSLEKTGSVNTSFITIAGDGREEAMNNFLFLLMNSKSSQRKHCKACGGSHWTFVRDFEPKEEKDAGCLCSKCGSIMVIMTLCKVNKDDIINWIKSEGEINPFDLIRDGVDSMIKTGEIEVDVKKKKDE